LIEHFHRVLVEEFVAVEEGFAGIVVFQAEEGCGLVAGDDVLADGFDDEGFGGPGVKGLAG